MNEENIKLRPDILKWIIIGLFFIIIIVLIFGLGVFVGEKKTKFSYRWAEEYHKMFAGPPRGFLKDWQNFPRGEFLEAHGNFGEIIQIKDNEFVIKKRNDVEKVIVITENTIIQKGREEIKKEELKIGDFVVIIGQPNKEGKIEAKLIRVFPPKISFKKIKFYE